MSTNKTKPEFTLQESTRALIKLLMEDPDDLSPDVMTLINATLDSLSYDLRERELNTSIYPSWEDFKNSMANINEDDMIGKSIKLGFEAGAWKYADLETNK